MHSAEEERLAEDARGDEPFRLGVRRVITPHESDLEARGSAFRRCDDSVALGDGVRHRFLEQHVLSSRERSHRLLSVETRGRSDHHDTHVFAAQQLVERRASSGVELSGDAVDGGAVGIEDRGEARPGDRMGSVLGVSSSHRPNADNTHTDAFARHRSLPIFRDALPIPDSRGHGHRLPPR